MAVLMAARSILQIKETAVIIPTRSITSEEIEYLSSSCCVISFVVVGGAGSCGVMGFVLNVSTLDLLLLVVGVGCLRDDVSMHCTFIIDNLW